jgi:hypothetical protein
MVVKPSMRLWYYNPRYGDLDFLVAANVYMLYTLESRKKNDRKCSLSVALLSESLSGFHNV